jgi:hypothetical protein
LREGLGWKAEQVDRLELRATAAGVKRSSNDLRELEARDLVRGADVGGLHAVGSLVVALLHREHHGQGVNWENRDINNHINGT